MTYSWILSNFFLDFLELSSTTSHFEFTFTKVGVFIDAFDLLGKELFYFELFLSGFGIWGGIAA